MNKSLWALRLLFLGLCMAGGLAVSQVRPELIERWHYGLMVGFGLGAVLIAIDEMVKGLSLRTFSAASFGLLIGSVIAWMVDRSELFRYADEKIHWVIRLALFLAFSYIGMILAMRSNKEDFTLIIPFVRFAPHGQQQNFLLLDTSVLIDGRIVELLENRLFEGVIVVPRFVLKELQTLADSADATKRARGRRGLDMAGRLQSNFHLELKIHEADIPEERDVDGKLVRLAKLTSARLFTNDFNLSKVAELQGVSRVNLNELAHYLKTIVHPGDEFPVKIVREGKDRGQGVGFLPDGTMIVVNQAQTFLNQQVEVLVSNVVQTGAGKMIFADLKAVARA